MITTALLINDNSQCIEGLADMLVPSVVGKLEVLQDFSVNANDLQADLYLVKYCDATKELIKNLAHAQKMVILLLEEDDATAAYNSFKYHVTDYILISQGCNYLRIKESIMELQNNATKKVVVVDDSKLSLKQIGNILELHNLKHIAFTDVLAAMEYIMNEKNVVDLVITDYEMPQMNGYEFVQQVRSKYTLEKLPILVLSATQDKQMIARFLKAGANDYVSKPFIEEEFIGRVSNTLKISEMFFKIQNMAMTDHLTGLHNRAYFYSVGEKMLESSKRSNTSLCVCLGDIDNFKKINDTYGHDVGDLALRHVAACLQKRLRRSDILVRFGGEEFVILLANCPIEHGFPMAQKICEYVAKTPLEFGETKLNITLSLGISANMDTLDKMVKNADKYMYHAKTSGKNRAYTEEI